MRKILTLITAGIITLVLLISVRYAGDMESFLIHKRINIIGAEVRNFQGEILGRIIELEYDNETRNISFAILSLDWGSGIGEKMIPVPISALQFRNSSDGFINITKEKLASAPGFEKGKRPDMSNRKWSEDTYRFYGIRPYWKE